MHPPILRCLVAGAVPSARPFTEPGRPSPVPSLLAIETLTTYLRTVDPRTENSRTWNDFVADYQIRDRSLLSRCNAALRAARAAANERKCQPLRVGDLNTDAACATGHATAPRSHPRQQSPAWQLRLTLGS
jgi:hypothetical protein